MSNLPLAARADTRDARKARGAFFTPEPITRFVATWALRTCSDAVLEPSAGDAAFLVEAVQRLRELANDSASIPTVAGVEIHGPTARSARERVLAAGGAPQIDVGDFFEVEPTRRYDAVIGNPPYIRFQDFSGPARSRARAAALSGGVALSGLASSWAAFVVHSTSFLVDGGRLGLVLPAELLSVNYASSVRKFLFDHFESVELVLFDRQVFPEAEADVVLLLADGYDLGPTEHAKIYQTSDASTLASLGLPLTWVPEDPAAKWTAATIDPDAAEPLRTLTARGHFCHLEAWGATTLGMVTGNNKYFALSPARATELGIGEDDLLLLSPPGSAHLRGLSLTKRALDMLGEQGSATWLFRPDVEHGAAAGEYISAGEAAGVHLAYKCQVRKPWYRVPLVAPADLLLTCMNADTPRLTTNSAGAHHLNSVHGVYLDPGLRTLGRSLLPLASLNSVTLLNAEMVGRSYGGGVLKIEPREADRWAMPSPALIEERAAELRAVRTKVSRSLQAGELARAVALVDDALGLEALVPGVVALDSVRAAREKLANRRKLRGSR